MPSQLNECIWCCSSPDQQIAPIPFPRLPVLHSAVPSSPLARTKCLSKMRIKDQKVLAIHFQAELLLLPSQGGLENTESISSRRRRDNRIKSCDHPLPTPLPPSLPDPRGALKMQRSYTVGATATTGLKAATIHFPLHSPLPPQSHEGLGHNFACWLVVAGFLAGKPAFGGQNAKTLYRRRHGNNRFKSCNHPLPTPLPPPSLMPGGP